MNSNFLRLEHVLGDQKFSAYDTKHGPVTIFKQEDPDSIRVQLGNQVPWIVKPEEDVNVESIQYGLGHVHFYEVLLSLENTIRGIEAFKKAQENS